MFVAGGVRECASCGWSCSQQRCAYCERYKGRLTWPKYCHILRSRYFSPQREYLWYSNPTELDQPYSDPGRIDLDVFLARDKRSTHQVKSRTVVPGQHDGVGYPE
jgi:hypothetical protein